jgi:hypothetical protein
LKLVSWDRSEAGIEKRVLSHNAVKPTLTRTIPGLSWTPKLN